MLTTKMIRLILLTLSLIVFTACDNNDNDSDTTTTDTPVVETAPVAGNIAPIAKAGSPETTVEAGETVKFSSRHSSDPDGEIVKYQWFENGVSIAKVPSLWKMYNVAGTYNIKLVVTDNDGATSSAEYTVTVTAPPPPPPPPAAATAFDTYFENNASTPLIDSGTVNIVIGAADAVPSVTKITTTINVSHTWVGDLRISLKSPTGTTINLINRHGHPATGFGTSGDDFINTTFDDDASTAIEAGSPPFTGTFIPEEPLANFVGEDAVGTWTLSIEDNAGADTGDFHSWSMTVE